MTDRAGFVRSFGEVFEHSAFIAERAYDHGRIAAPLRCENVQDALNAEFRTANRDERLGVLRAHPDLAGKLAIAGELTAESASEQAGAGLDRLSTAEHARFTHLNTRYMRVFGFPFIIAVKGLSKNDILKDFEARISNDMATEFETACAQVEKIAGFRIAALLPEADKQMVQLSLEPLTPGDFASFGNVLDTGIAEKRMINEGTTERFHALAMADTEHGGGRTILSLFRGQPREFPYQITMMERHPLGSQAFFPLTNRAWIAVVAADDGGRPGRPRAFRVPGDTGVQYARNIWHHPLIAVEEPSSFMVMDREGAGNNLEEMGYPVPYVITDP